VGIWTDPAGGLVYSGEFRSGVWHGHGVLQVGPTRYAGEFRNGRMHGQGVMELPDGSRYVGTMVEGAMTGIGRLIGPDGRELFNGQFADGRPVQGTNAAPARPTPTAPVAPPVPPRSPAPKPRAPEQPRAPVTPRQEAGFASGRITMPDGSPLPPAVERVSISISGVSAAGVNVSYAPMVRADGTYRQQLVPGAYRFGGVWRGLSGSVTVRHQGRTFELPLEPVGTDYSTSRDAADGIVQNFVWKPTGPTPSGLQDGLDPGSHTHWFGMRIGTQVGGWLADFHPTDHFTRGLRPSPIPDGTQVTLRLRPLTPSIDGRALRDTTIVRDIARMGPNGAPSYGQITTTFHDLPPADYELTGFATLPSGNRHALRFRGTEADRLGYVREARVNLEWDSGLRRLGQRTLALYLEGDCPTPSHPTCGAAAGNGGAGAPVGNPAAGFVVGAQVEILYSQRWYPGVIKAVRGGNQWLVGYDGYGTNWDEVVGADRLRLRSR
jgi:hypothetical protein